MKSNFLEKHIVPSVNPICWNGGSGSNVSCDSLSFTDDDDDDLTGASS